MAVRSNTPLTKALKRSKRERARMMSGSSPSNLEASVQPATHTTAASTKQTP